VAGAALTFVAVAPREAQALTSLNGATVVVSSPYLFPEHTVSPTVKVVKNGKTLKKGTDYAVIGTTSIKCAKLGPQTNAICNKSYPLLIVPKHNGKTYFSKGLSRSWKIKRIPMNSSYLKITKVNLGVTNMYFYTSGAEIWYQRGNYKCQLPGASYQIITSRWSRLAGETPKSDYIDLLISGRNYGIDGANTWVKIRRGLSKTQIDKRKIKGTNTITVTGPWTKKSQPVCP
jgi:hypothetical protein